jgi:hypothetical protein
VLTAPDAAGEGGEHRDVEPIEPGIAVAAFVDVPEQDAVAVTVGRWLGERARTRDRALTGVEPLSPQVPPSGRCRRYRQPSPQPNVPPPHHGRRALRPRVRGEPATRHRPLGWQRAHGPATGPRQPLMSGLRRLPGYIEEALRHGGALPLEGEAVLNPACVGAGGSVFAHLCASHPVRRARWPREAADGDVRSGADHA